MSGIKRAFFGYLYNLNREIEPKKVDWSSEASTEAIFVKEFSPLPLFKKHLDLDVTSIRVRGEHEGILGFYNIRLQWDLMTDEEQLQALRDVKKISSGEKIIYWTRGANIHDPRKWFFKIERK